MNFFSPFARANVLPSKSLHASGAFAVAIGTDGKVTKLAADMGTTNGIEVSPDGKTLYVNESVQRNVWSFDIGADGNLSNKKLVKKFDDHGFDGMRCDVDGNLYITRYGKGTVAVLSPNGKLLAMDQPLPAGFRIVMLEVAGGKQVRMFEFVHGEKLRGLTRKPVTA
jgi:sugar lactone lactonase YvrE